MRTRTMFAAVVSAFAAVASNLYWYDRTRTIREGLAVSSARDEAIVADRSEATRAPEELLATIEAYREDLAAMKRQRDAAKSEAGSLRSRWAERWWRVRMEGVEEPQAIAITIEGEAADARAIAKHAPDYNEGVTRHDRTRPRVRRKRRRGDGQYGRYQGRRGRTDGSGRRWRWRLGSSGCRGRASATLSDAATALAKRLAEQLE